jgi:hypothetical protein
MSRPVVVALIIAATLAALAAGGEAPASAATLSYGCSPPLPPTADQCPGWHTSPVTLYWAWSLGAVPVGGNCSKQTFSHDTAGLAVSCEVRDDQNKIAVTVVIKIDSTPPSITGMVPARPQDHDDWWNHPLGLSFIGTDATSGIASCDTVTYAGPDGAAVPVTGACRDNAGNTASRSVALNYDATPPGLTRLTAKPRDRSATITWTASADAVYSEVMRTPGVRGEPASAIYRGQARKITDRHLANGVRYQYTVSAYDAAGNAASATVRARPSSIYSLAPSRNARLKRPPVLRWPRVRHASYYNVQVFRGRHKILSAWPKVNHLRLHRTWSFNRRLERLTRGRYGWYVWPGLGSRTTGRYGRLIGHLHFYIVR